MLGFRQMDKLTPGAEATDNVDAQPADQNSGKEAWVTPVVREYDPAEATNAFSGMAAVDSVFYS